MNCPQLHAHKSNILKVKQDKYLGDVISFDGKNDHNIKKKVSASLGAISNIINIMREICLGKFYFKTAFLLRQTIFLSTVLLIFKNNFFVMHLKGELIVLLFTSIWSI